MAALYREIKPSARLADYVECYWLRESSSDASRDCILPDGCVDILFSGESVSVVGLMTSAKWIAFEPGSRYFGARFHPGMATAFLQDAALLNDRVEPLENLWGARARLLGEQLADAQTPIQMAAVMEQSLVPAKVRGLDEARSERHARRLHRNLIGVSPKLLDRILRFRHAVERIGSGQPNWAQFAAACGYYDQAHMIHEFQEFAGCTPGRYLQYRAGSGK